MKLQSMMVSCSLCPSGAAATYSLYNKSWHADRFHRDEIALLRRAFVRYRMLPRNVISAVRHMQGGAQHHGSAINPLTTRHNTTHWLQDTALVMLQQDALVSRFFRMCETKRHMGHPRRTVLTFAFRNLRQRARSPSRLADDGAASSHAQVR